MQQTVRAFPQPAEQTAPGHALGPKAAIEDYVKAIYSLERRGSESVSTTELASRLDVPAAAASAMARRLGELGLATHRPYRGIALTEAGRQLALEVMRHHRLIETFLSEVLGMSWDRVHEEADVLEHVISEDLEALIARKLGEPKHDPHGDPIPNVDLEIEEGETVRLTDLEQGSAAVFVRVSDADPEMLRYLGKLGIGPGDRLEMTERQPFGGPVIVRVGDRAQPLGPELAAAMRVELAKK